MAGLWAALTNTETFIQICLYRNLENQGVLLAFVKRYHSGGTAYKANLTTMLELMFKLEPASWNISVHICKSFIKREYLGK